MNLLLGADPELFVRKNGQLVSGYGLIPGTKRNPYKVDKGAVQVDGMALEFNIDPVSTEGGFCESIQAVIAQLEAMVPDYELATEAVANFGDAYIKAQPDEAKELGCDPDFSAYTRSENPTPDQEAPFRTAAGHVHIGWTEGADAFSPSHFSMCCEAIKQLDLYLGIPSLLFDDNVQRRELYGKAGAFRPKTYGVEYRTLSNAWLKDPELISWVFRASRKAIDRIANGHNDYELVPDLASIINNSDVEAAKKVIDKLSLEVPDVLG